MGGLRTLSAAALIAALVPTAGVCVELPGSMADDLQVFPNEVLVITAEELAEYNINTLDDILALLPGVNFWRYGPPGSRSAFSIDGRSSTGISLFVNGEPFCDPYSFDPLSRFLPLSRLVCIEVIYSGSPFITGELSSNGAINLVIEEGGRQGPTTELDFTYGRNNQRARRIWFSTPRSFVSASLAYDEYLQDAFETPPEAGVRKLGLYDSRSILMDLSLISGAGDDVLVRIQKYEDTYTGTGYSSFEEIRYNGFDSRIRYRRAGFTAAIGQRNLDASFRSGYLNELQLRGEASWSGRVDGVVARSFIKGERSVFNNVLLGQHFDPSIRSFEGGVSVGKDDWGSFSWRAGLFGGNHSTAGGYVGWEAGIARDDGGRLTQNVMVSRRLRRPTPQELYQPDVGVSGGATGVSGTGCTGLESEVADEISIGAAVDGLMTMDMFWRWERSRIITDEGGATSHSSDGTGSVAGARIRFTRRGGLFGGISYGLSAGMQAFAERSPYTPGIPEYRALGGIELERRVFKDTEILSLRWDLEAVGKRSWYGEELDPYLVTSVHGMMTLMGARIRLEMNNILDVEYETVPGYMMSERNYRIGIFWQLPD